MGLEMEFFHYGNLHTAGKLCYVCPLPSAEPLDKSNAGNRIMGLAEQITSLYSELFNKPHCDWSLQNQYPGNL